ncbi:hypothetical protein [Halorubrum sp. DTA46]|uniref:hypothetical protein n=1 Tax=Halorubrum sp. DTA46 TaxID=3402162 RepID=UPI003AADAD52
MTPASTDRSAGSHTSAGSDDDDTPAVVAGSRVATTLRGCGRRLGSWIRASALYQWLTAEPDPEVIVIDLRETRTVGPVLRLLDRAVGRLGDAAGTSRAVSAGQRAEVSLRTAPLPSVGIVVAVLGVAIAASGLRGGVSLLSVAVGLGLAVAGLLAMRDDRDWATLRETRPMTLARAAFTPPDPPESAADDDREPDAAVTRSARSETSQDGDPAETLSVSDASWEPTPDSESEPESDRR